MMEIKALESYEVVLELEKKDSEVRPSVFA